MRVMLAICAVAAAILVAPSAPAAAAPGPDEYLPRPPSASGVQSGASQSSSQHQSLPGPIRDALSKQPDGKALAQIAGSPKLGAPPATATSSEGGEGSETDPSVPSAALSAIGGPGVALALVAILAISTVGLFKRRSRGPA